MNDDENELSDEADQGVSDASEPRGWHADEWHRFLAAVRLIHSQLEVEHFLPLLAEQIGQLMGARATLVRLEWAPGKPSTVKTGVAEDATLLGVLQPKIERLLSSHVRVVCLNQAEIPYHFTNGDVQNLRSLLVATVWDQAGNPVGLIALTGHEDAPFGEREALLLTEFVTMVASALENVRRYEEVRQAVKLRDFFISMASHELKTPITAVKGFADLLQRRLRRVLHVYPREQRMLDIISREAARLGRLIDLLLDFSYIQMKGQLAIDVAPLDLCALTRRVVGEIEPTLEQHRIELECLPGHLLVGGDSRRLEQVLDNLIANAVQYSPSGGEIVVQVQLVAGEATVTVTDPGIGVPPEEVAQIFESFYRAENVRFHGRGGMGLGLYVVNHILQAHGGSIQVANTAKGGATFTVRLPQIEGVA